tara:strand:+ start:306 stop:914 length:609 start_codon:yes stop_codon:yes gene_type:complete
MIKDTYIKGVAAGGGSVGEELMQTGQTTVFRTGGDGDLQKGRPTDFLTLGSNNPFGNTNRFTDEIGGSTYTNKIVIDWSTFNGTIVLGFYADNSGTTRDWNAAIDWALTVSIGAFTSGWYLPNKRQMYSLINDGAASHGLNYSPFSSFSIGTGYWSGTTTNNITTYSTMIAANRYSAERVIKTLAVRAYAVREFTVTGTTLT